MTNAALPAIALFGTNVDIAGTGVVTVNVTVFEVPPPGAGLNTVTETRLTV